MRIVHVDTQRTWRGGERQALELIKGLNARDVDNVLVCKRGSEIARRAEHASIRVVHLPLRAEWDLVSASKLRSYVKKHGVDIVHAHDSHAHTIAFIACVGVSSCKLVVSRRVDFHVRNPLSRFIKYGPGVDKILSVSDAVKRILVEDGIPEERVKTVRSGFITSEFDGGKVRDLRAELGVPDDVVVIATVAALAPHKAHHVLLKAARYVTERKDNVLFLFAGEGDQKDVIVDMIANLKLERHVRLLDFVEDIQSVYTAADIFSLSSREEGLCTSILDAMYFELPIVATHAGGIPELVKDGVNGFIVPVNDPQALAERLLLLADNPERRVAMGSRSKDLLENNRIDTTIEKTYDVYRELTEKNEKR